MTRLPSHEEAEQFSRALVVFSSLSNSQWQKVVGQMRMILLAEGETLFEFGARADRFFVLFSGKIKLYRLSARGGEKILEIVSPKEFFAAAIMFMEAPRYPVAAEALSESVVFAFKNDLFLDVLRESPESCLRLLGDMSRRMRGMVMEINRLSLSNAAGRLVAYLIGRCEPQGLAEVTIDVPKRVLAARLSIQPETFSRILSRLKKEGLIEERGKTITIPDVEGLQRWRDDQAK
ncbi:Crp/Fnr family transcriptional regulator [Magnetococcales bacterium HHB-1]